MLPQSLFSIILFCFISAALCAVGVTVTWWIQGSETAVALAEAWIFHFNGILVGGTGYGLLYFIRRYGANVVGQLINMLDIPQKLAPEVVRYSRRALSWKWCFAIGIPLTGVGTLILGGSGFPLNGFAKYYLGVATISIYFVASCILTFLIFMLGLFRFLEESSRNLRQVRVTAPRGYAAIELETLDAFFIISATMGLLAIYVGFRGTLTANFTTTSEMYRKMLIMPVIFYLPAALLYSFYPRYVVRKIRERDVLSNVDSLSARANRATFDSVLEEVDFQKALLELKEKLRADCNANSIIGFKDAPSLTVSILIVIQFILHQDATIAEYLKEIF